MNDFVNVASYLKKMAREQPYKRAVVYPSGRDKSNRVTYAHLTFMQLDQESDRYAHGLEKAGLVRGMRTILMVKPSLEFFALVFALFKLGAVPVMVDPGMGFKRMLCCFRESNPSAFIGILEARFLLMFYPKFFKAIKVWITTSKYSFRSVSLKSIQKTKWQPYKIVRTTRNETAAILFTTGSTGPAKGVVYTHGIFDAQIRHIKSHFGITTNEIDLPSFPLFALFAPALGMTAVIPDMDPTKPSKANPEKIIEAITNHGVTNMFASPALLNVVGHYGRKKGIKLPSLKRVISAGAPVSTSNIERFASILCENAEIHTPYGATEAMPVISIGSNEILSETGNLSKQGYGVCIGRAIDGINAVIIKISDNPIENWSDNLIIADGEIGEIVVSGNVVTNQYFQNSKADALSKIKQGDKIWHRMGDVAWKDKKNRFWFCGRKSHRVITENGALFTIPCEAVFNNHPDVFRSALVGIGSISKQRPVICIELNQGVKTTNKKKLKQELLELSNANVLTKDIKAILFHKSFPVDIRHNSKIFREKLAVWAEQRIKLR